MSETVVRELSDGEELIVDESTPSRPLDDPRELMIETRRRALAATEIQAKRPLEAERP